MELSIKDKIYHAFNHKKEVYRLSDEICKLRQEIRDLSRLIRKNGDKQAWKAGEREMYDTRDKRNETYKSVCEVLQEELKKNLYQLLTF